MPAALRSIDPQRVSAGAPASARLHGSRRRPGFLRPHDHPDAALAHLSEFTIYADPPEH